MRLPGPLLPGTLVRRYQRFLADVRLADGRTVTAHCPNSGSLAGCQEPGSPVLLSERPRPGRRLSHTWEMVRVGRTWVGVNTMYPNRLVHEALEGGAIRELAGYTSIRREVMIRPGTRLDLLLERARPRGRSDRCYVEVKNVTSRPDDGAAAFPDAVTARGQKHLRELMRLRRAGHRAAVVFVVQRGDCDRFRPWDEVDPEYGRLLRWALTGGVEALPYRARVGPREIRLEERLPMIL